MKLTIAVSGAALLVYEKKRLKKAMRQAGAEVAGVAKSLIRSSARGGRTYYRDGRSYTASQPGGAPAKLTGALLSGLKVKPFRSGEGVAVLDAASHGNAFYALFLEGGAKGGGKGRASHNKRGPGRSRSRTVATTSRVLLPRPFLSKALDLRRDSIERRIIDAVEHDVQFVRMKP